MHCPAPRRWGSGISASATPPSSPPAAASTTTSASGPAPRRGNSSEDVGQANCQLQGYYTHRVRHGYDFRQDADICWGARGRYSTDLFAARAQVNCAHQTGLTNRRTALPAVTRYSVLCCVMALNRRSSDGTAPPGPPGHSFSSSPSRQSTSRFR